MHAWKSIGLATSGFLFAVTMTAAQLQAAGPAEPDEAVTVSTAAELLAALVPQNAGLHIRVLRGDYAIDRPLTLPDGVRLEGEGIMRVENGLPVGFETGTTTTIRVAGDFEGDLLTLGNGAALFGLRLEEMKAETSSKSVRSGNLIVVGSRAAGDTVSATIRDCEIVNHNGPGIGADGPIGAALLVITRNPGRHLEPLPHVGANLKVRMERSVVLAKGSVLFAINFAAGGTQSIALQGNRFQGTVGLAGGVSRPDQVSGASVNVDSRNNLYALFPEEGNDNFGWLVIGGSSSHLKNLGATGPHHNLARIVSFNDRIEGFQVGIRAIGGRRWLGASGPVSDNRAELELHGTRIETEGEGAADLQLHGALSEEAPEGGTEFPAGDRNVLRVLMQGVTGSASLRPNVYTDVFGPTLESNHGTGNRIEFVGTVEEFTKSNRNILPPPPAEFFRGEGW